MIIMGKCKCCGSKRDLIEIGKSYTGLIERVKTIGVSDEMEKN